MSENLKTKNIDQLLADADELVQQIHSDAINDMEESHRMQFEKHAQKLKKIKSKVQGKSEKKEAPEADSGGEGIHEAIMDIVKVMQGYKNRQF